MRRKCVLCETEISGASGGASVGAARSRGQVVEMIGTRDTRGRGGRGMRNMGRRVEINWRWKQV